MASMSRNGSTSAFQGFSVSQAFIGAPLQWLPAIGSVELDELVHAFLPGPSSIQDKRAHISMDFFEYARQTGETFKFYAAPSASFAAASTDSPATSSSMYESGYNSSFNVSPIISDLSPWAQSPASFSAPSVTSEKERIKSQSSKKSTASSSRQAIDFTNHPGMRIMTKDGRDITNSASRGSKSKEQRDHAHLMRIIKACPDCKRKKIRCDPSHKKKNSAPATPITSQTQSRLARKDRKKTQSPPIPATPPIQADVAATSSFDLTTIPDLAGIGGDQADQMWNEFVQFDQEPLDSLAQYIDFSIPQEFDFLSVTQDFNFNSAPQSNFTPSLGSGSSSASPSQVFTPFTPPQQPVPCNSGAAVTNGISANEPLLPYLNSGEPHGTNYVDFNLYSPPSDFLDEELQHIRALPPQSLQSRESRQRSVSPVTTHEVLAQQILVRSAPTAQTDGLVQDGFLGLPTTTSATQRPDGRSVNRPNEPALDLTTRTEYSIAQESGVAQRSSSLARTRRGTSLQTRNAGDSLDPQIPTSYIADCHDGLLQGYDTGSEGHLPDHHSRANTHRLLTSASYSLQTPVRPRPTDQQFSASASTAVADDIVKVTQTSHPVTRIACNPLAHSRTDQDRGDLTNHVHALIAHAPTTAAVARAALAGENFGPAGPAGSTEVARAGVDSTGQASAQPEYSRLATARRASSSRRRSLASGLANNILIAHETCGTGERATHTSDIAATGMSMQELTLVAVLGFALYLLVSVTGAVRILAQVSGRLPSLAVMAGAGLLALDKSAWRSGLKPSTLESQLRRGAQRVFLETHGLSYPTFAVGINSDESRHPCGPKSTRGSFLGPIFGTLGIFT